MENKKKQLLDVMKALPMTMEDKCAFVDLISQNSNGGGTSQEDEYFYFDVRDINSNKLNEVIVMSPYVIVNMDNKTLEINGYTFNLSFDTLIKTPVAINVKRYICFINDIDPEYPTVELKYYKLDTIKFMNSIGAKQITKEEYNSFINFTIDNFEEIPIG